MNKTPTYEFRVRTFGDVRDWDQIPVTQSIEFSEHEPDPFERATLTARRILNLAPAQAGILYNAPNPVEVRLNLAGSLNGHYVRK